MDETHPCVECGEEKKYGEMAEVSPGTRWHPPEYGFICVGCMRKLQRAYGEQAKAERDLDL